MYLMCTQEKSVLWQCRREYAAEEAASTTITDLLQTGEGISARLFLPPLTEAAIFESPKFSKVLRTAFIISCQCCSLLYANSYHFLPKFILPLSLSGKKIRSFQQRGNKKLLFHNLSSRGQQYSGHCQGICIHFLISDETASESTASSPI